MRLIATFSNKEEVETFSLFLTSKEIESQYDLSYDIDMHPRYDLWVLKEEDLLLASEHYKRFLLDPNHSEFSPCKKTPVVETQTRKSMVQPKIEKPSSLFSSLTHWILIVCAILFLANNRQEETLKLKGRLESIGFYFTPIEKNLLFDYPFAVSKLDTLLDQYPIASLEELKSQPLDVQQKFKQALEIPVWKGCLSLWENKFHKKPLGEGAPLFEKISQGEVWRLFSPTLLHRDFWHIFFNMGWLLILGKQIEHRLGKPRLLLLILVLGVFSNVVQYVVSGPYFLGFSGVVAGFAGFIWSRQKKAPWEGYPFHRTTAFFLFYLILIMLVVSIICFLLQTFSVLDFSSNIANAAHIAGGIMGLVLGRFQFFAKRVV